jgi:hypothetical protein
MGYGSSICSAGLSKIAHYEKGPFPDSRDGPPGPEHRMGEPRRAEVWPDRLRTLLTKENYSAVEGR